MKYDLKSIEKGHHKVTYRGVPMVKCPFDYVIYQMIIWEIKPDLIIEIGTNKGGSALYFSDLLKNIGKGTIHTIDITNDAYENLKNIKNINFFDCGWENYNLDLIESFDKILVIDDGAHTFEQTYGILEKFHNCVSVDSYIIVEDGIIEELGKSNIYNGGPKRAILKFLKENDNFEVVYKWLNFFGENATFNPMGYLKKSSN